MLRWYKDRFTVFLLFGKGIGRMQSEASNWTLGARPIAHESSVPQSVKNGQQDSNLALWKQKQTNLILIGIYIWRVSYQGIGKWMHFSSVLLGSHSNRYSYPNADYLNEKQLSVDVLCCSFPQAAWVNLRVPGQSSTSRAQKRLKKWLVHFITCDCKSKTAKIPVTQLRMFLLNAPLFVTL